jgi:hypothetical protein
MAEAAAKSPYKILGVSPSASQDDIKTKFRQLGTLGNEMLFLAANHRIAWESRRLSPPVKRCVMLGHKLGGETRVLSGFVVCTAKEHHPDVSDVSETQAICCAAVFVVIDGLFRH